MNGPRTELLPPGSCFVTRTRHRKVRRPGDELFFVHGGWRYWCRVKASRDEVYRTVAGHLERRCVLTVEVLAPKVAGA